MKIHASINRMVNKEDSAIKAYASVTMDGMFAVHGLRVIETENLVNVDGAWYVFDTQGGRFLKSDKYGDITRIFDESDITIDISVSESAY